MRYTLTVFEPDYEKIKAHLSSDPSVEQAGYLMCRLSQTPSEMRLLAREFVPVLPGEIIEQSAHHMKIDSRSYTRAMKYANDTKCCFVFVHSHPHGYPEHSSQDDAEEAPLFTTAYVRIRTAGVHGSLVMTDLNVSSARVWLLDGSIEPIERVRIIGKRFRFWFSGDGEEPVPEFFDRQVRAFGKDIQVLLKKLRIGVVGVGGTGSCVAEQLIRLGVGELRIADGETFDSSNVNRVYGSRVIDQTLPKVKLTERMAADIGLGTKIDTSNRPVTFQSVLASLRDCDIIFGCTDDEWGRSLLTRFAVYYGIPVLDMGVQIDSENGTIRSIQGRVTMLMPGTACLYCRGRIASERIAAESKRALNPQEAAALQEEGYIPELQEPAPAVVPFTTTIAAGAVSELLHRLTGFLGDERESSEVLYLIDDSRIRTNRVLPREGCFCSGRSYWGRGDVRPFLDTTWRPG